MRVALKRRPSSVERYHRTAGREMSRMDYDAE